MKNWEKYEKEIKEFGIYNIAVTETGEVKSCDDMQCSECKFSIPVITQHSCYERMTNWLYEEYKEPPKIDWTKVPVDTPIYVRNYEDEDWTPRYFAEFKNGIVFAWDIGATSFTTAKPEFITPWKCVRLAEDLNNPEGRISDE